MSRGLLELYLGLLSLGFIGVFHKLGDRLKCRPSAINLSLFFWAGVILLTMVWFTGQLGRLAAMPGSLYVIACVCGFIASIAILSFQAGLKYGKIATSWVIVNLSLALPTILSILIYKEPVGAVRVIAMILIVPALLLIWKDKQLDERAARRQMEQPCGRG
jgi:drug/metabolite transporter (DMT)-like permease